MELKYWLPIASMLISLTALYVSLSDRRPSLTLRTRKGHWCKLDDSVDQKDTIFRGIIEVYNVSSRANAIRGYEFWCKGESGDWERMESEYYQLESLVYGNDEKGNETPLTLMPYSGKEVPVIAFRRMRKPTGLQIRIQVEDLFAKHYEIEVTATA